MDAMPFLQANPRHPIAYLVAGFMAASGLGFLINSLPPSSSAVIAAFFLLFFLSVFFLASPFLKPIRRSLFLALFAAGTLFLRYIGLTNPIHTVLLAILLISLDSISRRPATGHS